MVKQFVLIRTMLRIKWVFIFLLICTAFIVSYSAEIGKAKLEFERRRLQSEPEQLIPETAAEGHDIKDSSKSHPKHLQQKQQTHQHQNQHQNKKILPAVVDKSDMQAETDKQNVKTTSFQTNVVPSETPETIEKLSESSPTAVKASQKSIPTATGGFVYTFMVFLTGVAVIGNGAFLVYVFVLSK